MILFVLFLIVIAARLTSTFMLASIIFLQASIEA